MKKIMIVVFAIILFISLYFSKKYTNDDFHIKTYVSDVDKDEDGIEDQRDILESVKSYIAKKPKYKSQYYSNGYPDDEYGVCTDVVAFGLLGAGYNLMELVNEDILKNPELYSISHIDKQIDFRRVKNLIVYFRKNAIALTNDISKIEQWQGGDIVVFSHHIGVISDRRNRFGIPYVIHHAYPGQIFYEEDILKKMNDIVGHFRVS